VWNRHKDQLRAELENGCYPIVWAEAVSAEGHFQFQSARRGHLPYLRLKARQGWLLNHEPCILVQRTTAKEQKRRLIAAVMPNSFVLEYPGFVVENHLNMVYTQAAKPSISLRTLAALLNSGMLDQILRCINGSVAVSAYELNSLPLPSPEQMEQLQPLVFAGAALDQIDRLIEAFYTSSHELDAPASAGDSRGKPRAVAA
jgi:adenine-specific DNA-methyltransferase